MTVAARILDVDGGYTDYTTVITVEVGDSDGDGVRDTDDNCPADGNADQPDTDDDGAGDACDDDDDNDGVPDGDDNCPLTENADQADADDDGQGDVCDPDDDNDGVPDGEDICPGFDDNVDTDGDGVPDGCDDDDDNDGIPDDEDDAPLNARPTVTVDDDIDRRGRRRNGDQRRHVRRRRGRRGDPERLAGRRDRRGRRRVELVLCQHRRAR